MFYSTDDIPTTVGNSADVMFFDKLIATFIFTFNYHALKR
jgi:hypothetical protein